MLPSINDLVPNNIAKMSHKLPSMTIQKCPMPIPFTSKDRVTYQINGKITMSKEKKNKQERLIE